MTFASAGPPAREVLGDSSARIESLNGNPSRTAEEVSTLTLEAPLMS